MALVRAARRLSRRSAAARLARAASTEAAAPLKIGLCQMLVSDDKLANIARARAAIGKAAANGVAVVSLPEVWNGPYATTAFPEYAEPIPEPGSAEVDAQASPSARMMAEAAREHGVHLVGGSISERCEESGRIYNSCAVFSPEGTLVAKHRKMHLFDIDIPGKMTFKESETLTGGAALTTFDAAGWRIGVGICYDMRFPEMAAIMRDAGCSVLWYPGAFNTTTGPRHWELLQRARAVDNQCYVVAVSPARNPEAAYQAYGHSTVVGPWGDILATTEHDEAIIYATLDMEQVADFRSMVPISTQKRSALYDGPRWVAD